MKCVLHLAVSSDGFIAKPDGDSDWVAPADELLFKARAKELGSLVVGNRTFKQYQDTIYPVEGALNIVLSSEIGDSAANVVFATSPQQAIDIAESAGCTGLLIAGGAKTSAAFLESDLIDEVFFSIHPIELGEGIKPFGKRSDEVKLTLLDTRTLKEGLVERHYRVEK